MGISTHVLDTAKGRPAAGVPVALSVHHEGTLHVIIETKTDDDGRARLVEKPDPGTYRLTFGIGDYNPGGFFPAVTIVFRVEDTEQHYHVPLLLSPFGYTTYRGS